MPIFFCTHNTFTQTYQRKNHLESFCDQPSKHQLLRDFTFKCLLFGILIYSLHCPLNTVILSVAVPVQSNPAKPLSQWLPQSLILGSPHPAGYHLVCQDNFKLLKMAHPPLLLGLGETQKLSSPAFPLYSAL